MTIEVFEGPVTLPEHEDIIEHAQRSGITAGRSLRTIRDQRMYKEAGFDLFEDYCKTRWNWSIGHAHRLLTFANIDDIISPMGEIQLTERATRELVPLMPTDPHPGAGRPIEWRPDTTDLLIQAAHEIAELPNPTAKTIRPIVQRIWTNNRPDAEPIPPPTGTYHTIVIDPPWPITKIQRDERPNQHHIDYPTMTLTEIADYPVPDVAADDAHLYLWTTQKHLPNALTIANTWGFKYQCLLTWVKNVGFTPFSWMYSTEHVIFATRGNQPLTKLGLRLDFNAPTQRHSKKPDIFYDLVTQASPEPRVELFSRQPRDGFTAHGNDPAVTP